MLKIFEKEKNIVAFIHIVDSALKIAIILLVDTPFGTPPPPTIENN